MNTGHADARHVERAIEDEVLAVVAVGSGDASERLRTNENSSDPDAAVLAVAHGRDATAVVDEQYGRNVADAEGISTRGTASLVCRFLADDVVTAEEARSTVDAMVDAGWYCAPDLYAAIQRQIDELA